MQESIALHDWETMKTAIEKYGELVDEMEKWIEESEKPQIIRITRKRYQEVFKAKESHDEEFDQVTPKESFFADLFQHDIGNLTALLRSRLNLMLEFTERTHKKITVGRKNQYRKNIAYCRYQIGMMLTLLEGLTYWVEGQQMKSDIISAKKLKQEVKPHIKELTKHEKQEVKWKIDKDIHFIGNDPTVKLLLINCIKNAIKRGKATKIRIEIKLRKKDRKVRIRISDNGSGIDQEIMEKIYEPGEKGNGSKGSGLGLANAPERLHATGATISCIANGGLNNEEGNAGAQFEIEFPKAA